MKSPPKWIYPIFLLVIVWMFFWSGGGERTTTITEELKRQAEEIGCQNPLVLIKGEAVTLLGQETAIEMDGEGFIGYADSTVWINADQLDSIAEEGEVVKTIPYVAYRDDEPAGVLLCDP